MTVKIILLHKFQLCCQFQNRLNITMLVYVFKMKNKRLKTLYITFYVDFEVYIQYEELEILSNAYKNGNWGLFNKFRF